MLKVRYFDNRCLLRCTTATITVTLLVFYMQLCQIITTANEGSLVIFVETRFTCDNGASIRGSQVCDRKGDCPDYEDELGCARTCGFGEFKCSGKGTEACIPTMFRCDDQIDCFDGTDELNCYTFPPLIQIERNIKETYKGGWFSLSCFVYGEPISNIEWFKNDEPFPVPARCRLGRVSMNTSNLFCSDATLEDEGSYTCKGINPKKFAARARANTEVIELRVRP